MNANTNIDLVTLHNAIVADISAAFPALATVEFYREDRKNLPKPACLLEIAEFDNVEDEDPGTEQLAVMMRFEAQLVITFKTANAKRSACVLAAALAAWLRKRRWTNPADPSKKLPTGEARVVGAYRDDFTTMGAQRDTALEQFEIWRVEWEQIVHLGNTAWIDEGETPSEPYYSFVPGVGPENIDKYQSLLPGNEPL
jgi:hypothetical protein